MQRVASRSKRVTKSGHAPIMVDFFFPLIKRQRQIDSDFFLFCSHKELTYSHKLGCFFSFFLICWTTQTTYTLSEEAARSPCGIFFDCFIFLNVSVLHVQLTFSMFFMLVPFVRLEPFQSSAMKLT